MSLAISFLKGVLGVVFWIMKAVFPQRRKRVVFLSRQSFEVPLDFIMLIDELKRRDPEIECTCICCRSDRNIRSILRYIVAFIRSMYHLATSRVAVLNSYWPAVSMLHQRESLKVIQIWHALGKIKQSGWQTIHRDMGHSPAVARKMGMHRGYDVVIGGSKAWNPFYCASFNIDERKIANVGLPRLDFLQTQGETVRKRFFERYPDLAGKKIILYAPTFRLGLREGACELLDELVGQQCGEVIFKRHPNQPIAVSNPRVYRASDFTSLELLLVCDCLITDYSAIAVEAASINVPTYYYCFDFDAYTAHNGLNVNPEELMPHCSCRDPKELAAALGNPYPAGELARYRTTYVLPDSDLGRSTERICDMIEGAMAS